MKRTPTPKEYKVPDDLMVIWYRALGCAEVRDRYIQLRWFGYKGAIKAAAEAELHRSNFWEGVLLVYPELREKTIAVNAGRSCVTVEDAARQLERKP